MESCAPEGDLKEFRLKREADLTKLSVFPITDFLERMPPHARQVVVALYLYYLTLSPNESCFGFADRLLTGD